MTVRPSGRTTDPTTEMIAVLYCPECADEVPHRVAFKRGVVAETVCTECGRALAVMRRARPGVGHDDPTRSLTSHVVRKRAGMSLADRGFAAGRLGILSALPRRAVTKPGRLLREVRRDGAAVLLSVPRRAVTKPMRLMAELAGLTRRAR